MGLRWTPSRDAYDPDRFYSGDDYLCTCSTHERNVLLLTIDLKQLRPFIVLACVMLTKGEPRGFLHRARERMVQIWGTGGKADELIDGALHTFRTAEAARASWLRSRRDGYGQ